MKAKNYIGYVHGKGFEKFLSKETPTPTSHGEYIYVVGPFRTAKGARWAVNFGTNNTHFQTVSDAEKFAKKWQENVKS